MKIKIFNAYGYLNHHEYPYQERISIAEAENKINGFIEGKNVLDIKVSGAQCEYGWEMFQYVIIYEEE